MEYSVPVLSTKRALMESWRETETTSLLVMSCLIFSLVVIVPREKKSTSRVWVFFFAVRKKLKQSSNSVVRWDWDAQGHGSLSARLLYSWQQLQYKYTMIPSRQRPLQLKVLLQRRHSSERGEAGSQHNATGSGSSTSKRLIGNVMVNDPYTLVVGVVYY